MFIGSVCLFSLCYGVVRFIELWKKQAKSDGIVLLLLCGVAAGYLTSFSGGWPTVESLNRAVYSSVSHYMMNLMKIKLEDQ
ncbi:hypothetical protein ACFQZT_28295 [Paenibacillus sp. GCM10027628]|uniref:hypothetical protein n=1 Tax=Paenibacillus sp. GCM10027628 TaxID=3273413 RepID=UPI003643EF68